VNTSDLLTQYGAIGLLLSVGGYILRTLWQRQTAAHDRDIARADKAETQLAEMNKLFRESLGGELAKATMAVAQVTEMLTELRHSWVVDTVVRDRIDQRRSPGHDDPR